MSIITVQLGQCGNQIGSQFFKTVHGDATSATKQPASKAGTAYHDTSLEKFFYSTDMQARSSKPTLCARSVLVDMETKVKRSTLIKSEILIIF